MTDSVIEVLAIVAPNATKLIQQHFSGSKLKTEQVNMLLTGLTFEQVRILNLNVVKLTKAINTSNNGLRSK